MEKTIWKFQIEPNDIIKVDMPIGAEVLTVQTQFEQPCIWAIVNPKAKTETRTFRMADTGHPVNENVKKYIGTFQLMSGQLIFHLFE